MGLVEISNTPVCMYESAQAPNKPNSVYDDYLSKRF